MSATSFEEAGLMLCARDIRKNGQFAEHIFKQLETLIWDYPLRQSMVERMMGTAQRVLRAH